MQKRVEYVGRSDQFPVAVHVKFAVLCNRGWGHGLKVKSLKGWQPKTMSDYRSYRDRVLEGCRITHGLTRKEERVRDVARATTHTTFN